MEKVRFIYNPGSGENTVTGKLDDIIGLYQSRGYTIVPLRLDFRQSDEEIVRELRGDYHHLLIAGGDGTVNYLVNLIKNNGITTPVAFLPAGTANDFANVLGMPHDIPDACRAILDGEIRDIDLGVVNGRWFANVFSCGLFTDVSQKTPTVLKNTFGRLAYYATGVGDLVRFRKLHLKIESDGGNYEGTSVIFFVFNGRTAGKLRLAYLSEIDDGLLDVLILKGDNPIESIQTVLHYVTLPRRPSKYPAGMEHIRCTKLRAECTTQEPTDVDGEPGPDFPVEIRCEKGALKVICPQKATPKKKRRISIKK